MNIFRLAIGITVLMGGLLQSVQAAEVQLKFEVYQGDARILDALESRLLSGGAPAVEAMKKMPDFVKSRKVESKAELMVIAESGKRKKGASSKDILEIHDSGMEAVDGLDIEVDPVLQKETGLIDVNMSLRWGRNEGKEIRVSSLMTSVTVKTGEPMLLQRWSNENGDTMIILTATAVGIEATDAPHPWIYFDSSIYKTEADAQSGANPVFRMLFPSRSGQRAKAIEAVTLVYDIDGAGSLESMDVGFTAEIDPVLSTDGEAVDLNASVEFSEEKGGSIKTDDGVRLPKVAIRRAIGQRTLKNGEPKPVEMTKSDLENKPAEADNWRATFGVRW